MTDLNDLLQEQGPAAVRAHMDAARVNGTGKAPAPKGQVARNWRANAITAAQLQHLRFPPVSFIVSGLIPEGLSILAGRPKVGKSWLNLDVSLAVASGRPCLGISEVEQGDVLCCALEDNRRRLQRRLDKLISPFGRPWPERLTLATSWRRLDNGGVDDIRLWADSSAKPRLVQIDTLAGVRPDSATKGYTEDYRALEALHRLANDRGIAILVLHHTRKMEADDPVDTVSGTLGLTGCADTVLVLARSSKGTTLYVRGRDVEEAEHAVAFDKQSCRWSILGEANEVHRSNERRNILGAFNQSNEGTLGPQNIAAIAGMPEVNVRKLLGKMVKNNELELAGRGKYRLSQKN